MLKLNHHTEGSINKPQPGEIYLVEFKGKIELAFIIGIPEAFAVSLSDANIWLWPFNNEYTKIIGKLEPGTMLEVC